MLGEFPGRERYILRKDVCFGPECVALRVTYNDESQIKHLFLHLLLFMYGCCAAGRHSRESRSGISSRALDHSLLRVQSSDMSAWS